MQRGERRESRLNEKCRTIQYLVAIRKAFRKGKVSFPSVLEQHTKGPAALVHFLRDSKDLAKFCEFKRWEAELI